MLAPGRFRARATEWELGFADTGTEQVAVSFEILEEGDFFGHSITWYGFFTEGTQERTVKALQVCGWSGDDLAKLDGLDCNDVELVIEHELYQGQRRARVKWINRLGAGVAMRNAMDDAHRKVLADRMKGLVITMRRENGIEAPRSAPAARPPSSPRGAPPPRDRGYPESFDEGKGYGGL